MPFFFTFLIVQKWGIRLCSPFFLSCLSSYLPKHSLLQAQGVQITTHTGVQLNKANEVFPVNIFLMLPFRPQKIIWHGSTANGIRLVSNYCEAWHTADMGAMGQASPLNTGKLLDQKVYSCNNLFIVLCIENSFVTDPQRK